MAELNLRVNTQQAAQAAQAFQRILNDIKTAARTVDDLNFNRLGDTFNRLIAGGRNFLATIQSVTQELGRMNYTLQSIRTADYGARMGDGFRVLRDIIREIRSDLTNLNTLMRETATLSGRVGDAATRVRRTRATPAPAEAAAAMSTALVPVAATAGIDPAVARFGTLNVIILSTLKNIFGVQQALLGAARSAETFSERGLVVVRTFTAMNASAAQFFATMSAGARTVASSPLLLQGPRQVAGFQGGVPAGQQRGLQPFVFQGEATHEFGTALVRSSRQTQIFEGSLVEAKKKKDALDKNLDNTAKNTLPGFGRALTSVISILALFTVRALLRELSQLGQSLFEVGRDFENSFALFRSGARNDVDEASRRMQVATDTALKLGLGLQQTREDYARLSAAALGSSLEGQKIEKVFLGIASAQAVLGQNTEKGTGLIKVFTDILGKGRLQSEELVKQLGNIVPGSIRVVAEALQQTPQQLAQAIQRGTLGVEEVLTKLAEEFTERYGSEAVKNIMRLGGAFNVLASSIRLVGEVAINAGVGPGLIGGFKTLTDFLNEKETRVAVAQLANFITNVLGAAFLYIIKILQFLRDNLKSVIELFVFLTSAAFIAGILALARAFLFIGQVLLNMSLIGRVAVFAGLIASMILGKTAADKFAEGLEGAQKKFEDMQKEHQRLSELQAKTNDNLPDSTRAQLEAQEKVDKELRIFNQDLQNQIILFDKSMQGLDALSVEYEAYARVLERITALERTEVFERLSTGDKERAKQEIINRFLGPELQALIFRELTKFNEVVNRAKRERDATLGEFYTLERIGNIGPQFRAQQEFEKQLEPLRQKMQDMLFSADPSKIDEISAAFQLWATRLHNLAVETENSRTRFKMLIDDLNGLRDLRIDELITKITLGIRNINVPTDTTTSIATLEKTLGLLTVGGGTGGESSLTRFRTETERTAESAKRLAEEYKKVNDEVKKTSTSTGGNYQDIVNRAAGKFGVDPSLINAMMRIESGGDPNAVSGKGAGGLMQLMPGTATQMGVTDVFDPEQNIFGGTKYIRQQLDKFNGNVRLALAAYNAGPGRVTEAGGIPAIKETQDYVTSVMKRYRPVEIEPITRSAGNVVESDRRAFLGSMGPAANQTTAAIQKTDKAVIDLTIDIEKYSDVAETATNKTQEHFDATRNRLEEIRKQQAVEDTILRGAASAVSTPDAVSQDRALEGLSRERFTRERLIETIRVGAQAAKEYGLTQDDVTNKTEKYFAVLERQRVASELYTNERLRQGHFAVLAIEEETTALRDQLEVLNLEQSERGIALQKRQQERELSKIVLTPADRENAQKQIEQQAELARRIQDTNGPLKQYSDNLASFYSNTGRMEAFQNVTVDFFKGIEDQIVSFATTGKFSFEDFAKSFIASILRMMTQALIIKPILDSLQQSLNSSSGGGQGWVGSLLKAVGVIATGAISGGGTSGGFSGGDFPGAATGGMVTMQGIRHFQSGGFTGMGTDTVPAMLTPGEIVLNKAQQKNVANSMNGRSMVINNQITINTPNADSFRKSQRQIEEEMSNIAYASMKRAGHTNLTKTNNS